MEDPRVSSDFNRNSGCFYLAAVGLEQVHLPSMESPAALPPPEFCTPGQPRPWSKKHPPKKTPPSQKTTKPTQPKKKALPAPHLETLLSVL